MKLLEIALLGAAAYFIFVKKGSAAQDPGIPVSQGFEQKLQSSTATVEAAKAPLPGGITIRQAPQAVTTPQIKAQVNTIFQNQYSAGAFVPSSYLTGKLTRTDLIIAGNLAKKNFV